jgi:hypothetical protein
MKEGGEFLSTTAIPEQHNHDLFVDTLGIYAGFVKHRYSGGQFPVKDRQAQGERLDVAYHFVAKAR